MVCPNCGEKLTKEMLFMNTCSFCGEMINKPRTQSNYSEPNTSAKEKPQSNSSGNKIEITLYVLGALVLIVGTIGSFSLSGGSGKYYHFTFSTFIVYELATFLFGFMTMGIAKIIQLLNKINNKLK